ncbi:MAG: HD domain-containing protein [Solirubrobacterales bacterium]|nr:HD domain-containing protein [Solirubrobacterales bacterium]MCB8971202.1 HD domain-containing protein [Thermoleophilales bacterium]MCO5325943.1 HD domain-containing protein [Solirubrobacterales bacterium]
MAVADELAGTEDEREALARVREATGESDGPMERHGVRCFLIAERLAADRGREIDREVLLIASLLHDLGLYEEVAEGDAYVTDGRHYAERMLSDRPGWDGERLRLLGDAIERHHELRSQWDAGAEVELLRLADRVELAGGLIRCGIPREWLRDLGERVPRDGTYGEIARMVAHALRERPLTMAKIFVRGKGK